MKTVIMNFLFLLLSITSFNYAQPDTLWSKLYPNVYSYGQCIRQTTDNGYILSGVSNYQTDSTKVYCAKLDVLGNKVWEIEYGKKGYMYEAFSITPTKDGSYIIAGGVTSLSDNKNYGLLIKINTNGQILFAKEFSEFGTAVTARETLDGGYVFVRPSPAMVIKTDSRFNILWSTLKLGGTKVELTKDEGFIALNGLNYGKVDKNGRLLWKIDFPINHIAVDFTKTLDNKFIITGEELNAGGFLMKINSDGNIEWETILYGGVGGHVDQTNDGGFVVTGFPWLLLRTDPSGNRLWNNNNLDYWGASIQHTKDGGCITLGSIGSFLYIVKYKPFKDSFINVISPVNNDTWISGSSVVVKWKSNLVKSNYVNIDLSTDAGTTWKPLTKNQQNDGDWRIQKVPNYPSNKCKIKVSAVGESIFGVSSGLFTIARPVITITYPSGGEVWTVGSSPRITWKSNALSKFVNIDLSTNSGTSWISLSKNEPDDGDLRTWKVPNLPSTKCKIRVMDISGYPVGISNGYFTITNSLGKFANDEDVMKVPTEFALDQNYPNPFNPTTSIQYSVSSMQFVTLKVYDVLGNEIATLVNEEKTPGYYEVEFNAGNLSSGVYIYRLNAGSFTSTKKLLLMK